MLSKPFFVVAFLIKLRFRLGDKQGMLVNDECSSWYNRLDDFLYQFGIGENCCCTQMDQHAWPDKTTPLLGSAWSMALSVKTVKCE